MTVFRPFRNNDPPALANLWNRALPDRGVVRPLSPHEFDTLVMGKLPFDRRGLIVAQDDATGQVLGFVHAGFGPKEPGGKSHQLDRSMGTVAMLVTEPNRDLPEVEMGLFLAAERHLRSLGAQVIYAGGRSPLTPFYWGIYGGSEFSGILGGHQAFHRAVQRAGYQPVAGSTILEVDLSQPEPRDPRAPLIRRQVRLDICDDALTPGWWEALAIGLFRPTRYMLIDKAVNQVVARAWTWDIAGGFAVGDGKSRTALIAVDVEPSHRRKGLGRHLVTEILRRAREQNTNVVAVQTDPENAPALGLYGCLGFEPVDSATFYRLPAELMGRSSAPQA